MKSRKSQDNWAWLPKPLVAAVTGYSVRHFSDKIQPRLDASAQRGRGAKLEFDVRAVVSALVAYIAEQNKPKPEQVDPLLGGEGEGGDALEEYRREATKEKRLKNAQTERQLIDRVALLNAMLAGFAPVSTIAQKFKRRFGTDGVELWNDAVDAMRAAIVKALEGTDEQRSATGGNQTGD